MSRISKILVPATAFCFGVLAMTAEAQTPSSAKQDWSSYATYGEIVGEVVKFEDPTLTLKITKYQQTGGNNARPIRPGLRPTNRPPQVKTTTEELDLTFNENALVRWYKLAPKIGPNGKKVQRSSKEIQQYKLPQGAPGYAGNRADLQAGQTVSLVLVRPRDISPSKLTPNDIQVKYAVILGYGSGDTEPAEEPAPTEKK